MKAVKIILLSVGYTVSGLLFAFALMGVLLGWWLEGEVIAKTAGLLFFCVPLSVMLWRPWEGLARRFAQRIIGIRDGRIVFDVPTSELNEDATADLYRETEPMPGIGLRAVS
jgi:hypothetical protein